MSGAAEPGAEPLRVEAPQWLRQRLSEHRAEHGKPYQLAVLQGFLEVSDWAYFLIGPDGRRMVEDAGQVDELFERVFERTMKNGDPRVRIVGGQRGQHFIVVDGAGVAQELTALNLNTHYRWAPDPSA